MKYRKKPIVVDAVQWFKDGDHPSVLRFNYDFDGSFKYGIQTLEGTMWITPGCWIVGPGAQGEYWPVQDYIFKQTYEPVDDESPTSGEEDVNKMLMFW
jgi:hypothetical protein